jgi:hypothetical protein
MKLFAFVRNPQGMEARFIITMPGVIQNHQRLVKKQLFGFRSSNTMLLVFTVVSGIPLKTG